MNQAIIELLTKYGYIEEDGHFDLKSGFHSRYYINLKMLTDDPEVTEDVCIILAQVVKNSNICGQIDTVVGPAYGAIILAYEMSKQLGLKNRYTEKDGKNMIFRRLQNISGKRVLVVEDVITTGDTVKDTIKLIRENGGIVVGVAAVVDRSDGKAEFDVPFLSGAQISFPLFSPDECPICKEGVLPLIKPGSKNG